MGSSVLVHTGGLWIEGTLFPEITKLNRGWTILEHFYPIFWKLEEDCSLLWNLLKSIFTYTNFSWTNGEKGNWGKTGDERNKMEKIQNKKYLTVLCKGVHTDCTVTSNETRACHIARVGFNSRFVIVNVTQDTEKCNWLSSHRATQWD